MDTLKGAEMRCNASQMTEPAVLEKTFEKVVPEFYQRSAKAFCVAGSTFSIY